MAGKVVGNVLQGTAPKGKVVGNVLSGQAPAVAGAVGKAVRGAAALQPPAADAQEPAGLYGAFAQRGAELGGDFLQFFDTVAREPVLPPWVYESAGVEPPPVAPRGSTWLGQAGDYLQGLSDSVNFQPRAPFQSIGPAFENEGFWGGMGTLGRFLLEQGVTSIPDMAAAVGSPLAYGTALTQGIAEERAANEGRPGTESVGDLFAAAPGAAASALLERYGGLGILKGTGANTALGRIGGAAGREAMTEFLQEQAQYAGETVGTEKGFDLDESLLRGAAGALGGAGLGGAGRGAVELVNAAIPSTRAPAEAVAPPPSPGQPAPPAPPPPATKREAAAAGQVKIGETVGLKTPNPRGGMKVINATPERVEGGVVFWRDEDGNVNTDAVEDFVRDQTAAAPPKKPPVPEPPPEPPAPPVVSDPLAGAEPDRTPMRQQPAAPLLGEPAAQVPLRQPKGTTRDTADDLADTIRREQMALRLWDDNIAKAQAAIDRGDPSAKSPEDVAYMLQAREDAAGRLAAALRQRDQGAAARGAEAEAATDRVRQQRQAQNVAAQEAQAAEAEAAMQRVQGMPRAQPEATTGELRPARPYKPQGIVAWIAGRGGMRDPGGELRAMDLQRRPGFIRKAKAATGTLLGGKPQTRDAWDPDTVREAAVEAGYLPEGATISDLLSAIDADLRGERVVAQPDTGDELEYQEQQGRARQAEQYEDIYGTDPVLAQARYEAEQLGIEWADDTGVADLRAEIDERLAIMDEASVADFEAAQDGFERELEEMGYAESEPAVEDRAAEDEGGQAGREAEEGDAARPEERTAEGDVRDELEDRGRSEEEAAGGERTAEREPARLESVRGARAAPVMVTDLKGNKIAAPRVFYRGTNPGDDRRIKTGDEVWDSYLFAASNERDARLYGHNIEILDASPDTRILYEGTAEWRRIAGTWRRDENMLQYARRASDAAKAAGYDAAWFKRQGDIGTAIFNPEKFSRSQRLESVRGAPGDAGKRPFVRPVTQRGRGAINRRVQAERWRLRKDAEKRRAEGRSEVPTELTADEEVEVQNFTQFLGDHLLEGVGLGIVKGADDGVMGDYDPTTGIVTVYRAALQRGLFTRTMIHELWHATEGALTPEARGAIIGSWRQQAAKYARRNPWFKAFMDTDQNGDLSFVSSSLPPSESAAFLDTPAGRAALNSGAVETRARPDGTSQVYIRWTDANYRLRNPSEFFAESMTDRYLAMREDMDAVARGALDWLRVIWDRIVASLRRLYGPDVMGSIFNGFRDGAVRVPQNPLPPIYEDILDGVGMFQQSIDPNVPAERVLQQMARAIPDMSDVKGKPPDLVIGKALNAFKQATWIARFDTNFARLFQTVHDEHYSETTLINDGGDAMRKALNLNPEQRETFNKIMEVARLAGRNIPPTGRRIVMQVPNVGINGLPIEPALSKPGEIIRADMATTEAVNDVVNWLQSKWYEVIGSRAYTAGYTGEFTAAGIAQAKADAIAKHDKQAQSIAEFAEELYAHAVQNERDGYVPLMRYGDTAITVKEKNPQPGANPVAYFTLVDTGGALKSGRGKVDKRVLEKIAELQARYPKKDFTIEYGPLGEAELNALDLPIMEKLMMAAQLKNPAAAVKIYQSLINLSTPGQKQMFKDIAGALPQAARRQIIDEIKSGFLKRSRNVPGYDPDFLGRALLDYNRATAGVIAKSIHRHRMDLARKGVMGEDGKGGSHETVKKWTEGWLKYIDQPEADIWRAGRFLGFYMNMFGSISSSLVNLWSTMTVTIPQMMAWSNTAPSDVLFATRYGAKGIAFAMKRGLHIRPTALGLQGPLRDAVIRADKDGLLSPSLAADLYGKEEARYELKRRSGKALQSYLEVGASLFNYAEQANRYIAFIAAYKAAQKPKNLQRFARMYAKNARVQEMVKQRGLNAETVARFVVENTQFIGGQIDRSRILRGPGGIVLQFKQYALNYLRLLRENFADQGMRGKMVGMAMLLSMFYFAGLIGVPGVEDLMVLFELLYTTATWGEKISTETALRELAMDLLGVDELGAEQVLRGASREYLGVDLSSRIGIGRLSPEFGDPFQAVPLLAATVGRMQEAFQRYSRGETAGGTVALLSPLVGKGVADALRGFWVLDQEGYVTKTGTQKFAPHDITWGEKIMQAMGLRPARFARTLEYDYAQRRIASQMNGPRAALMDQLANAFYNAERARADGDEEAALEFEEEALRVYDEAWEAYSDPDTPPERLVKPPEWKDIWRAVRDREDEPSRIKRAPEMAREAMESVPYIRE